MSECHCNGDGWIVVCVDDMCRGSGECIHGDGMALCPCQYEGDDEDDEPDTCPLCDMVHCNCDAPGPETPCAARVVAFAVDKVDTHRQYWPTYEWLHEALFLDCRLH